MRGRYMLGCIVAALVVPRAMKAAELSVVSLTMPPGSTATLEVQGNIDNEETFGVTVVVELVPTNSATGSLEFTPTRSRQSPTVRPSTGISPSPPVGPR